jgi:two-component system phosphate regulon response regulator PhoB
MVKPTDPLILVVEDEPAQLEVLAYNVSAAGYRVITALDGDDALAKAVDESPDLIVLDWMLPNVSGIEICRRLRLKDQTRATPIIMVSARGEEGDKVLGLESGADDYVSKPYSIGELIARIRANLRRSRPASAGQVLTFDGIVLNGETYRVTRDDVTLKLGPTEFRLLSTLMEKPGKVWSRDALLDRVWGRDIHVDDRTVDVHIGRLRKALKLDGCDDPIRTVRGAGYAIG